MIGYIYLAVLTALAIWAFYDVFIAQKKQNPVLIDLDSRVISAAYLGLYFIIVIVSLAYKYTN